MYDLVKFPHTEVYTLILTLPFSLLGDEDETSEIYQKRISFFTFEDVTFVRCFKSAVIPQKPNVFSNRFVSYVGKYELSVTL